jgi:hypothetical protein
MTRSILPMHNGEWECLPFVRALILPLTQSHLPTFNRGQWKMSLRWAGFRAT